MRVANCSPMVLESFGTRLCVGRPRAVASAGCVVLWCVLSTSYFAQWALAAQPASGEGVPVIYRGQEVVRIYRGVGGMDPVERARLVSERLNQLVRDPDFDPTAPHRQRSRDVQRTRSRRPCPGRRDGRGRAGHRPAAPGVCPTGTGSRGRNHHHHARGAQRLVDCHRPWKGCTRYRHPGRPAVVARAPGPPPPPTRRGRVPTPDRGSQGWAGGRGSGHARSAKAAHRRRDRDYGFDPDRGGRVGRGHASRAALGPAVRAAGLSLPIGTNQDVLARPPEHRAQSVLPRHDRPGDRPGLEAGSHRLQGD